MRKRAVILLSGGLDSATTLAMAIEQGFDCYTLSFDYQQRLRAELMAAKSISTQLQACEHRVVTIDINQFGGSALTDLALKVPDTPQIGIPITYVPARNTIFLSIGLSWAETLGAQDIFYGANVVDYSGYPDCRPEYIAAFEQLANLATKSGAEGQTFSIQTPLLYLTKAEIIQQGLRLGVDYAGTVSCYNADDSGRACRRCDACRFRAEGFAQLGVIDPTRYVKK